MMIIKSLQFICAFRVFYHIWILGNIVMTSGPLWASLVLVWNRALPVPQHDLGCCGGDIHLPDIFRDRDGAVCDFPLLGRCDSQLILLPGVALNLRCSALTPGLGRQGRFPPHGAPCDSKSAWGVWSVWKCTICMLCQQQNPWAFQGQKLLTNFPLGINKVVWFRFGPCSCRLWGKTSSMRTVKGSKQGSWLCNSKWEMLNGL